MNALNQFSQIYYKPSNVKPKQYATIDISQLMQGPLSGAQRGKPNTLDLYQYYSSARQTVFQKENLPSNEPMLLKGGKDLASKSATQSTASFCKDELITRIKKLNQIRQKSQQNVQPLSKKRSSNQIPEDQVHHQRYRSTTQQKSAREQAVSFHQLLQKTQGKENTIQQRYVHPQEVIQEEPSPFQEFKNLNDRSEVRDTSISQGRSRIKESLFRNYESKKVVKPTEYLAKISNIAGQLKVQPSDSTVPQGGYFMQARDRSQKKQQITVTEVKKSIENMCRLSNQQLNLMQQTRNEIAPATQQKDVHKITTETVQLDLTCDEEVQLDTMDIMPQSEPLEQEDEEKEVPGNYSKETLEYFIIREKEYLPDPHYLSTRQTAISWQMRAILIDWMMEVCCEFHLKRETFHLSVAYLDQYLSQAEPTLKAKLQLVGLAAMVIATKIEEIFPRKVSDFARAADYGYSIDEILQMEMRILFKAKWQVNPPTINIWTNWYMCQWDLFAEKHSKAILCCFKKASERSYQLFCQLIQLLDCSVLEVQSLQYPPRTLIASFMYLTLAVAQNIFALEDIKNIKHGSLFLLDQTNQFNKVFGQFVQFSFGFNLIDLLPAIQYSSTFFPLKISYDTPPGIQSLANTPLEGHYEEFLSFQMHSRELLGFVRERSRDDI